MSRCEICDRDVKTTRHHLIPKDRKNSPIARVCQPCHQQIHAVFTHHELKHRFDSVEALRESEEMQKFVRWVRKANPTNVRVDETKRVRDWRR